MPERAGFPFFPLPLVVRLPESPSGAGKNAGLQLFVTLARVPPRGQVLAEPGFIDNIISKKLTGFAMMGNGMESMGYTVC